MSTPTHCLATVKVLRPSGLHIAPDEPCVLEVHLPITLPHSIDPSLPAPPYHNRAGGLCVLDFLKDHAMPLMHSIMTQVVAQMFGSDYCGTVLKADTILPGTFSLNEDFQFLVEWDFDVTKDREDGFDFEAGRWQNCVGGERRGVIHAFRDYYPAVDEIYVFKAFKFWLVRGIVGGDKLLEMNPRVIRLDLEGEDIDSEDDEPKGMGGEEEEGEQKREVENGQILFEVREYTEDARSKFINYVIAWLMDHWIDQSRYLKLLLDQDVTKQ